VRTYGLWPKSSALVCPGDVRAERPRAGGAGRGQLGAARSKVGVVTYIPKKLMFACEWRVDRRVTTIRGWLHPGCQSRRARRRGLLAEAQSTDRAPNLDADRAERAWPRPEIAAVLIRSFGRLERMSIRRRAFRNDDSESEPDEGLLEEPLDRERERPPSAPP